MAGTIKIRAPWVMKRMETNLAGKITVSNETPTVDLLPDPPAPEQPPLAKHCVVTEAFRGSSPNHPSSVFVNYGCPKCSKSFRIALDNAWPGNKIIQCECGESITLPLAL